MFMSQLLDGFSLGWAENILKELFDLVDISLDLAVESYEWGVRAWCQVLEVCRLPGREVALLQITGENGTDHDRLNFESCVRRWGWGSTTVSSQPALVHWQTKLCLAATCLSAAFNPAHLAPDVPGRQMTPACADKNEHVLKEECERTQRKRGKTRLCVDFTTSNGANRWHPVREIMTCFSRM